MLANREHAHIINSHYVHFENWIDKKRRFGTRIIRFYVNNFVEHVFFFHSSLECIRFWMFLLNEDNLTHFFTKKKKKYAVFRKRQWITAISVHWWAALFQFWGLRAEFVHLNSFFVSFVCLLIPEFLKSFHLCGIKFLLL